MSDSPVQTHPIRRPQRLGDEVYDALYAQLMSRRIAPGARISIDQLVRELGVSQTPIREALSRLEAQGLVVKTHLIGYSAAAQIDAARLRRIYEMRLLLEPYVARAAASLITDEAFAQLQDLHGQMCAIDGAGPDAYGAFAALDGQFHDLIAQASGNDLMHDALARLHVHVHLFRLFYLASATTDANAEHAEIVSALAARDPDAADQAMRAHIERSRHRFARDAASG